MSENQFVNGVRVYKPNTGAPSFIIANGTINKTALAAWLQDQPEEDIRVVIKTSQKGGYYMAVDTWQKGDTTSKQTPQANNGQSQAGNTPDDLPF
jgi:hypothetical protein